MSELGRRVRGPIAQPHVRPWSTVMRVPTDDGIVWFKANGPGAAQEGPLLEVFRTRGTAHVLLPLAVHPARPWLLFEDGGPTLRATRPDGTGDHDLGAWERVLSEYAGLQRSLEGELAVSAMLAAGTPDGRPSRLAGQLDRLLDDDQVWGRVTAEERTSADAARRRLRESAGIIRAALGILATSRIPATIQHDDLHGGNVFVGADGDRVFDWGDAVVAHPFATLTATFNSIAHATGLALDDPPFARLRAVYLEPWTDRGSVAALVEAARLARDLGCIGKALAWERAMRDLESSEMDERGDAVASWLMELADRLPVLSSATR